MQRSVTVVVGMHRSGTSLCANVLQRLGIDMASDPGASPSNARGHWERPQINDLNDRVFLRFGRGWDSATHHLGLPAGWLSDPAVCRVKADIVSFLQPRIAACTAIGFKDPRTARLMPLWRAAFDALGVTPRFVFCIRDPAQVSRSLGARDLMEREQAEYRWALYNIEAIDGIGADPVCIVAYESWFTEPVATLERLAGFVGRNASLNILPEILDPELRHDGVSEARAASRRLHEEVLRCLPLGRFDGALHTHVAAMRDFAQLVQPMLVAAEVLRVSVTDQARVIGDLQRLVSRMRAVAA